MNVSLKSIAKEPVGPLRMAMGTVLILAAMHRIIFIEIAYNNFSDLGLKPAFFLVVLAIIIELAAGILFLTNKHIKFASCTILILIAAGIIFSIKKAGISLFSKINELFILTYTPTNIVLHIAYFFGVLTLLLHHINNKKIN